MSLVDYASSSDEENNDLEVEEEQQRKHDQQKQDDDDDVLEAEEHDHRREQKPSPPPVINQRSETSTPATAEAPLLLPSMPKLPDASMLLNSASFSSVTAGTDHASQVAAAMATRKKRDSNNLEATTSMSQQHPRSKVAKGGTLPHTKNVFDTAGGILVPPQLRGRSNIVTEDISKLFVKRQQAESGSQ